MSELKTITGIGLAAVVFIVAGKLITGKYKIPGLTEVFAMV